MPATPGRPDAGELAALADLAALYPNEPEHLRRYAEALRRAGEEMQALAVFRRLYRLHRARGETSEAQALVERFPELGITPEPPPDEPLGRRLPRGAFGRVWRMLQGRAVAAGSVLAPEEVQSDGPWLVLEGEFEALVPRRRTVAFPVVTGDVFGIGAMAGLAEPPLAYRARTKARIAPLPRARLLALAEEHPALAGAIRQAIQRRRMLALLAQARGLRAAPLPVRRHLAARARIEPARPGAVLWREGAPASDLLLVLDGRLALATRLGEQAVALARLGPGGWIVGFPPLSADARAPVMVRSLEATLLAHVAGRDLRAAALAHPAFMEELLAEAERLQQTIGRRVLEIGARGGTKGKEERKGG